MQKMTLHENFRRPFAVGVLLSAILLLLPLTALGEEVPSGVAVLPPSPTPVVEPSPAPGEWDAGHTVRVLLKDGTVEAMTMSDYLWRVVAAEMPASFEPQALQAQAVCARTYALWRIAAGSHAADGADVCADSACCQAYITPGEMEVRWAGDAGEYTKKLAAAVSGTDGQILTYGGAPIQAVYFSSSSPTTEDAVEVWGQSLPYLTSVDSPEGDEVPNYHSTVTLTAEEVRTLVQEAGLDADLSGDPADWFGEITRNASGRVASLELGGTTLSGGAARTLFSLRSACFEVEQAGGAFTFSVTGYGHGVGMSQYGANAMAKTGSSWREIVTHYYTGVTVQTGL